MFTDAPTHAHTYCLPALPQHCAYCRLPMCQRVRIHGNSWLLRTCPDGLIRHIEQRSRIDGHYKSRFVMFDAYAHFHMGSHTDAAFRQRNTANERLARGLTPKRKGMRKAHAESHQSSVSDEETSSIAAGRLGERLLVLCRIDAIMSLTFCAAPSKRFRAA